jgi:hypothetical protein
MPGADIYEHSVITEYDSSTIAQYAPPHTLCISLDFMKSCNAKYELNL